MYLNKGKRGKGEEGKRKKNRFAVSFSLLTFSPFNLIRIEIGAGKKFIQNR
jgi:hypothetical protein